MSKNQDSERSQPTSLYRTSFLGQALYTTLQEMVVKGVINGVHAKSILLNFDYQMQEVMSASNPLMLKQNENVNSTGEFHSIIIEGEIMSMHTFDSLKKVMIRDAKIYKCSSDVKEVCKDIDEDASELITDTNLADSNKKLIYSLPISCNAPSYVMPLLTITGVKNDTKYTRRVGRKRKKVIQTN